MLNQGLNSRTLIILLDCPNNGSTLKDNSADL